MTRSITFRRSLFWNLTAGILLLLLVFLSVARLHIEHAEERLATELTGRAVAETRAAVDHFFDPVSKLVVMWGRHFAVAGVDLGDPERLDGYFVPLLATIQHLSGVTLGSEDGRSYTLRRTETGWERRLADPSADPGRVQLLRWSDEDPAGATAWQDASYDPRSRPWFVAALEDRPADGGSLPTRPSWTRPYEFARPPGEHGVTGSVGFEPPGGPVHVISIDVPLRDISTFTMGLTLKESGSVAVLYGAPDGEELVLVGLPAGLADVPKQDLGEYLLAPPSAAGGAFVDYLDAMAGDPREGRLQPRSFETGGDRWWGAGERYGGAEDILILAVVPQDELVGEVESLAAGALATIVLIALVAVWRISRVSRQYASSIEHLVFQTERMAGLNFERGSDVETRIEEIGMLAQAQEQLRDSLEAISSRREDLLIARAMRAEAKLVEGVVPSGYELGVLEQCAEEVGGGVFDAAVHPDSAARLSVLLATVPGEGVAAASEALRVRSAFQAGVRLGASLEAQARQIRSHLERSPELHASALCVAEVDGGDSSIRVLADAGCPVFHFAASTGTGVWVPPGPTPVRIALEEGDSVLLATESVPRALSPARKAFGREALEALVRAHPDADAESLARSIGSALDEFTDGAPPERDRTLLVFRRAGSAIA